MTESLQNQKRTAIVYFGPQQEDYLKLVQAEDRSRFIEYIQRPLQEQLVSEMHNSGCCDTSCYTRLPGKDEVDESGDGVEST